MVPAEIEYKELKNKLNSLIEKWESEQLLLEEKSIQFEN